MLQIAEIVRSKERVLNRTVSRHGSREGYLFNYTSDILAVSVVGQ